MAIWTPLDAGADDGNGGALLPVAFFMPGGAFTIGGVDVPYQIPAGLVERTQKLIVVTVNYRLNIFGFPNAAALAEQNLGILDQRLALEWVHSNIAAFGGDPDRIIMWGHSAVSSLTHALHHLTPG